MHFTDAKSLPKILLLLLFKDKNCLAHMEAFLTNAMHPLIKLAHYDKTKKKLMTRR